MFVRIPHYNGFQLPRRMINDFLIGHDTKNEFNNIQKYDMTNGEIIHTLDNMKKLNLKPKIKRNNKTNKKDKKDKKNKKKTPPKKEHSVNRKKKNKRTTKRLPKINDN